MNSYNNRTVIAVCGDNVVEFLQGQLTCNLLEFIPGKWGVFAWCNRQAKVLATGYIYYDLATLVYLVVDASLQDLVVTKLATVGLLSQIAVKRVDKYFFAKQAAAVDNYVFELVDHSPQLSMDFYYYELLQKIILININCSDKFIPHMLGLQHLQLNNIAALSFSKGCYIGQEVVSRVEHKGQVKKALVLAKLQTDVVISALPIKVASSCNKEGYIISKVGNLLGCVLPVDYTGFWVLTVDGDDYRLAIT